MDSSHQGYSMRGERIPSIMVKGDARLRCTVHTADLERNGRLEGPEVTSARGAGNRCIT